MNKKGFTLIELLSSITIMTFIACIASFNIIAILEKKKEETKKSKESIIEKSACLYIELEKNKDIKENCLTFGCDISSDTLINNGLLSESDVNNSILIHIEKKNNEKICSIKKGSNENGTK